MKEFKKLLFIALLMLGVSVQAQLGQTREEIEKKWTYLVGRQGNVTSLDDVFVAEFLRQKRFFHFLNDICASYVYTEDYDSSESSLAFDQYNAMLSNFKKEYGVNFKTVKTKSNPFEDKPTRILNTWDLDYYEANVFIEMEGDGGYGIGLSQVYKDAKGKLK